MAISEQDLLKRDVLKSHIDSVNQRKLDMGPPSPRGNDYTRPVDEHVARGYFDEANQITPLGEEFLTLHDNGLVDNFGMATELGQSYLMSNREAQDAPVSVYRFREESGLAEAERFAASQDGEQRGFSDMIYDFATKSIPSAVETGYNIAIAPVAETALSVPRKIAELATGVDYKLPRTMSPNDITNAVAENMTGSILASEDIAAGAIYAGTMAMDDPATFGANILDKLPYGLVVRKVAGDPVMDEMVRRKTDESFAAKQAFERSRSEIAELTGAQMMETVAPIFQWAKAREQLVTENGEEAVKSKEENDRLLGSIALDPENVLSLGAGIAIKGATTAVAKTNLWAARTSLKNAALQAERAAVQSEMSAIQAGLTRPSRWISDAELKSKALVDVGDFQGATRYDEFIKRVNLKSEVPLQRISELSATEAKLGDEITQLGSSPDIANAILASKEKAASFRNLTAGGFGLTGVVGDKIGSAMIKADDFLDAASKNMGIDSAVSTLKSLPAAIGGYVMGGVPAGVTAALNVLARGKVVQSMGNFSKVLGSELMQERGSIGYWGRVAQNSTLTKAQRFLAHRADELTLGGSLMDVARPVVAGTVAAYPMNLAFEAVSNPDASGQEILTNAMGPALVFGGGSAGAGAVLQGRQAHLAQIRMADEYNFTRRMAEQSTEGSQAFSSLVPSAKRVVSTLAATYPNLNWDFSNKTESYYDPASNTINVNPESNNPLRPLISHEVLHYVTIRNQMESVVHSALLGDSETPGLIRNTDGTLDPEFKAFKDVYDARIANANLPPRTIEQVAEEYFNEATVDELLSMVDTGEVSRIAGRTQLGRKVKALIDATIPKITILKDLFNHTGGVRGMDGKPVMGNGLLAEGIRDLPEAKAIMRKLIRDSAGQDPTRATSGDRSGTRIEIKRGDSVIDSFHSIFEVDASGNPIKDKNGDPVPLSRATDEARKSAGLIIGEAQRDKVSNGYLPKEGEMKQQDNGSWQGRYIDKSLIDVLAGRGILNPKQIAILRNLSTATKGNQGLRFLLTNHPATIRNRKGKLNYATLEATLRESVPVGFSITKDGNILVHNMSVGQLDANITARAGSKRGIDLYSGNTESIKRDVSEMMELHQKNTATDEFYQNKYGSRWKEYQQFINTVFGLMTKEQQSINPMFQSDSISSQKGQVYRTYRLDRISKATRMDGATSMPFHYENIKMNFLPDGFADATKPADVNKIEDGFYSQLESVISKKIPTRATPEQIMATIDPTRGSGIKADEIKWSGIEQALPKLAVDGKVTKEALLKYLADEGNVRFEEVKSDVGTSMGSQDFSVHVLPGGENYREVVLAMPEVSMTQDSSSEFKAFMAEMTRKYPNEDGTFPVWSKMTDSEVNRMEVLEGEANAGKFSQTAKKKKEANYTSSHFPDIPNYVAHMRLDERTLGDGTRTLHSAEYQSDRHQEGRKKGYDLNEENGLDVATREFNAIVKPSSPATPSEVQQLVLGRLPGDTAWAREALGDSFEKIRDLASKDKRGVADAPFRTTWPLQLFKRQLRDAVEGGFDSVSWDVGETQNDRFDLSKSLDRVDVFKHGENDYTVDTRLRGGDQGPIEEHISVERVETLLGKDFASKVANQTKTRAEYSGDNLKAGGSGMRGFYDTMLPKEIGKYVKQWNGKVEKSEIGQSMSKDEIDMYDLEDATPEELAQLKAEGMVKGDSVPIWRVDITPEMRKISETGQTRYLPEGDRLPNGYKSHHDETLLKSAWNGTELDLKRPFKASDSLPSLAMRTKWEEKPLVSKDTFDFTKKARVVFGKNKNGEDVTFKYDPNLLNPPNIVDFAQVYSGEQIQYTIADRMSAVDGDMGGALHLFLKNNDIVIVGPDGKEYVVGWGNNSATVGTKMRKKAKDGAKVLMVYLMGKEAHQSNTRTVRLFDTQLENSSMPSHMSNIARAYSYIPIKEMKHVSLVKEVFKIDEAIKKAKELNKDSNYINKLEQRKKSASKEADKIKVSAYENELAGIFRKIKSSQTRLDNGNGKQSIIDANIQELSNFATSAKGKMLIKKTPSKFIYEMTRTFDGRKSAVSQISNLKLDDFNGSALSSATADMTSADKNAIVAGIDLSDNQDFFMLYVGDDPKQISAMTASEKAAATKLKQNSDFVVHEAYDTLILSPHLGRRNLNSRMENALDAVPDSFKAVLDDRPSVKAQVGKKNAKGNLILSEDNLLNTVRDQQTVPLIYNPTK